MEWRCEWCGKPHAEDDPPCDNCGHGSFERAVVPASPEGDDGGPLVWVCTDCGREHPRNNPPCSRCGGMTLEKQRQALDDDDLVPDEGAAPPPDPEPTEAPDTTTVWACTECGRGHPRNNPPCSRCGGMSFRKEEREVDDGTEWVSDDGPAERDPAVGSDTMTVWVCTECGRSHPRNNPPCSRCGAMALERREQRYDDLDAGGGGWRDAVDWRVALGFVAALALLAVVVGPALGYFDLPGEGPPPVEGVPGESEAVGGVGLADVERAFVARLGEVRADAGGSDLAWNRELAGLARYRNRWTVKAALGDGGGYSRETLLSAARDVDTCSTDRIAFSEFDTGPTVAGTPAAEFDSADAMAAALVEVYLGDVPDEFVPAPRGQAGADVHVGPDGRLYVTVFFC